MYNSKEELYKDIDKQIDKLEQSYQNCVKVMNSYEEKLNEKEFKLFKQKVTGILSSSRTQAILVQEELNSLKSSRKKLDALTINFQQILSADFGRIKQFFKRMVNDREINEYAIQIKQETIDHQKQLKSQAITAIDSACLIFRQPFLNNKLPKSEHWDEEFKQLVEEAVSQKRAIVETLIEENKEGEKHLRELVEEKDYYTAITAANTFHNNLSPLRVAVQSFWTAYQTTVFNLIDKERVALKNQHIEFIRNLGEKDEYIDDSYRILLDAVSEAEMYYDEDSPSEAFRIYKQAQKELDALS